MRWSRLAADDAAGGVPRAVPGLPCLTLPGLDNSAADHWQTRWEGMLPDCRRVQFGDWDDPRPLPWAARLGAAVRAHADGVVLAAHSLGCHAVLWWAAGAPREEVSRVRAAMLVAPPDVIGSADPRLRRFALPYAVPLPFRTLVVGSDDDPYAAAEWTRGWAGRQGADLAELRGAGHINATSGLGAWPEGLRLLARLVD